jgi:hypothetical protein
VDRCQFTDVSEVLTASIIRAITAAVVEAARAVHKALQPEDGHLQNLRCTNLKSY